MCLVGNLIWGAGEKGEDVYPDEECRFPLVPISPISSLTSAIAGALQNVASEGRARQGESHGDDRRAGKKRMVKAMQVTYEGVTYVAMESTGVYWKHIYNLLEETGVQPLVVNARDMKNVPGRKTDVKDPEWIADLLRHGFGPSSSCSSPDKRDLSVRPFLEKKLRRQGRSRHTIRAYVARVDKSQRVFRDLVLQKFNIEAGAKNLTQPYRRLYNPDKH